MVNTNTIGINRNGFGRVNACLRVFKGGVRPDAGLSTVWLC